jgi:hypothetical protein
MVARIVFNRLVELCLMVPGSQLYLPQWKAPRIPTSSLPAV